jgi:hypothetical protein
MTLIEESEAYSNIDLKKFSWLANSCGLELKPMRFRKNSKNHIPYLIEQIKNSHGFFITNTDILSTKEICDALISKIKTGSNAFACINYKKTIGLDFFQNYGLETNSLKARSDSNNTHCKSSDPHKFIVIDRESFCFKDEQLFDKVNKVEINYTAGLSCFGFSRPILSIPQNKIQLFDDRFDVLVDISPESNLDVMAIIECSDWLGKIIVSTTRIFLMDSYQNYLGQNYKCIESFDNQIFVKNILNLFAFGLSSERFEWEDLQIFFREIELSVANITRDVLRRTNPSNWFIDLIPEKLKNKLEDKKKIKVLDESFFTSLDFIDFHSIWNHNWDLFSVFFEENKKSSKKSLDFIQDLNKHRAYIYHPTKVIDMARPSKKMVQEILDIRQIVTNFKNKLISS